MSILAAIVAPITGLVNTFQKGRQEKRAAKAAVDRILAEAAASDSQVAGQIALVNAKNQNHTWKDEFALLVIATPYLVSFAIALLAAFGWIDVDAGLVITAMFEPLAQVPVYWQETFKIGMLSALGVTVFKKAMG
jgi:hypothetical protein